MSAALKLSSWDLQALAKALDAMTEIRKFQHVSFDPFQPATLGIGDNTVEVTWDDEANRYRIDDRNGF